MQTKVPINIKEPCLEALRRYEQTLGELNGRWTSWNSSEQEVITNTFLNLKVVAEEMARSKRERRIRWHDEIEKKNEEKDKTKNKVINNVRGNYINITVNNYIVGDKKGTKMPDAFVFQSVKEGKRPKSSESKVHKKVDDEEIIILAKKNPLIRPKKKTTDLMMYTRPKTTAAKSRKKQQPKEELIITNSKKTNKMTDPSAFYSTWK